MIILATKRPGDDAGAYMRIRNLEDCTAGMSSRTLLRPVSSSDISYKTPWEGGAVYGYLVEQNVMGVRVNVPEGRGDFCGH
jgi:hypothetical protein